VVPPSNEADLTDVKVLIVDDNSTNRRILEGLVTHWGMIPTVTSSGEEALALFASCPESNPFQIILTDMHMPNMDGFGFVERLKEISDFGASTIMMLTSGGQRGDAQRCQELGMGAYLLKPVRQEELRTAIARLVSANQTAAATPAPVITRTSLRHDPAGRRSLHVLVAEDNLVNQRLATGLLEKRHHTVIVVPNGKEALAALELEEFDLVLMDVQMPEMDGFAATVALREREKSTGRHQPVVAMTALAMSGDRERCLDAGMDGYITKPIRPQELDDLLDSYAARKSTALQSTPLAQAEPAPSPAISIEVDQLLARIDGDRAFLAELIEIFRSEYPSNLEAAQAAIKKQDAAALQRVAHTLKGALANLSAVGAAAIAAELETMGRAAELADAQATLDRLGIELPNVTRALEALCPVAAP
jgi:CheY-like chemotaxis protein